MPALVLLGKLQMTEGAYTSHHPDVFAASQSVEYGVLGPFGLDRVWKVADVAGALLRQSWQRHGRFDPLSLRHLRADGH